MMRDIEILKHQATRQYRHNDDNSPDLFNPEQGFVIAYDCDVIDKGLDVIEQRIKELEAELDRLEDENRGLLAAAQSLEMDVYDLEKE